MERTAAALLRAILYREGIEREINFMKIGILINMNTESTEIARNVRVPSVLSAHTPSRSDWAREYENIIVDETAASVPAEEKRAAERNFSMLLAFSAGAHSTAQR